MGRSVNDGTPCSSQLIHAEQLIAELEQENEQLKGVIEADDKRLSDAAISVWGKHIRGCDTPQEMAELINYLRPLAKAAELELHESFISGMECAADIADKHPTGWQAAEAIHAVLEPITRPEQER